MNRSAAVVKIQKNSVFGYFLHDRKFCDMIA